MNNHNADKPPAGQSPDPRASDPNPTRAIVSTPAAAGPGSVPPEHGPPVWLLVGLGMLLGLGLLLILGAALQLLGESLARTAGFVLLGVILLVVLTSRHIRRAWPDILVGCLLMVLITAFIGLFAKECDLVGQFVAVPGAAPTPTPATATVQIPQGPIQPVSNANGAVVLLLRTERTGADGGVERETARYKVTLTSNLTKDREPSAQTGKWIGVKVPRGDDDANLAAFVRDLASVREIYVIPEK